MGSIVVYWAMRCLVRVTGGSAFSLSATDAWPKTAAGDGIVYGIEHKESSVKSHAKFNFLRALLIRLQGEGLFFPPPKFP